MRAAVEEMMERLRLPVTEFSESLLQCGAIQVNVPCISRGMELEKRREAQAAADGKR